jgi:hypothetical protein
VSLSLAFSLNGRGVVPSPFALNLPALRFPEQLSAIVGNERGLDGVARELRKRVRPEIQRTGNRLEGFRDAERPEHQRIVGAE